MLQPARKPKSKSFLREFKDAIFILEDENLRKDLLDELAVIIKNKQENPNTKNGFLAFKKKLISYLRDLGDLKTANIWCRNISLDEDDIINLEKILFKKLLDNNCYGVAEIHLQDREINSPHIQYVGVNADIAEQVIAQIIVDLGYEMDIQSAMSKKNFIPFYQITDQIIELDLETEITNTKTAQDIEEHKNQQKLKKAQQFNINDIKKLANKHKSNFVNSIKNHSNNRVQDIINQYSKKKKNKNKIVYNNFEMKLKMYKKRKLTKFK